MGCVVNANHGIVCATEEFRVINGLADRVWVAGLAKHFIPSEDIPHCDSFAVCGCQDSRRFGDWKKIQTTRLGPTERS